MAFARAILIAVALFVAGMVVDRQIVSPEGRLAELDARLAERDRMVETLTAAVAERDARLDDLQTALRLLKVEHRVARLEVLEQGPGEDGRVRTRVLFQEVDDDGVALGPPTVATIDGRTLYVDALVIKFDDAHVELGDAWRGTSVCLFRRLFGAGQPPDSGTPLDAVGSRPRVYGGDDVPDASERDLWERFWDYANEPALARRAGVRALHGEAPFMELRPGGRYRVELRASGGLTIRPE